MWLREMYVYSLKILELLLRVARLSSQSFDWDSLQEKLIISAKLDAFVEVLLLTALQFELDIWGIHFLEPVSCLGNSAMNWYLKGLYESSLLPGKNGSDVLLMDSFDQTQFFVVSIEQACRLYYAFFR